MWLPSNTCFLGRTGVHIPNGISISSVIFAGLTIATDRSTYKPLFSVCNNRLHPCSTAMTPNNNKWSSNLTKRLHCHCTQTVHWYSPGVTSLRLIFLSECGGVWTPENMLICFVNAPSSTTRGCNINNLQLLIHASLGSPEFTIRRASQPVGPFLHSSRQSVIGHVHSCKVARWHGAIWTASKCMVIWAHQIPQPKWHLDRFSHFAGQLNMNGLIAFASFCQCASHVTHASLCPPKSTTQTASRSA